MARRYLILSSALALAFILVVGMLNAAAAQKATPIITTPTPQPTPTLSPAEARRAWLLTPEASGSGSLIFLPLVMGSQGNAAPHTVPASFTYEVKAGDTLWSLALNFGRDLEAMACVTTPHRRRRRDVDARPDDHRARARRCVLHRHARRHVGRDRRAPWITVAAIVAAPWNGFTPPPYRVSPRQRILLPGVNPDAKPRPDPHEVSRQADQWAGTTMRRGLMATANSSGR